MKESNESNNSLAGNQISILPADLVLTSVSGPASVGTGQNITVATTVKNQGAGNAGAFYVSLYLSSDAVITTSDTYIGRVYMSGGLAAGTQQTVNITGTISATQAPGNYFLGAIADSSNSVKESNETNNSLAGNQISILPADLVLTSVSGPASVGTGQNITVATTVKNQGAGNAGAFYVSLYLSSDAVITTSDTYIGRVYMSGGLAAGTQQTVNITGTISATQAPGSYFLGAIADSSNSVKESNETNNSLAGNQISILPADLVLTSVSGPASVGTGQNITVAATVKNQGAGNAGAFYVSLYLSSDAVITTSDTYIGRVYMSGLAAGAQQTVNITGTISATQAPGSYFLGAIADSSNSVKESNETNNSLAGNQISILPADLVLTSVSGPASVGTGQNITVSTTVKNQGAGNAVAFYVSLYLSSDAVITTSDTYIGRVYMSGGLAAGTQQTVNIAGTISATQAPGSYFLGAIADYSNSVKESNETNNSLAGNKLVIKKLRNRLQRCGRS